MLFLDTILQNRYRIIRKLGQGGMGTVYEALDQRVSAIVALKETIVGDNEEARRAFEHEAALLANLHHQALPRVRDYFPEGGVEYLVMDYIPGHDLGELLELRGAPFDVQKVLGWADELLRVLEYLHRHSPPILHRDIKPSNLKATKQGELFLLDFGLAKGAAGQMPTLMTSRSVPGCSPVYASPEQSYGKRTDARSDLYSLGATLYQLLTNKLPVAAPTRDDALEEEQPDPLRPAHEINPQVHPSISAVIQQAMAINRKQRYASATEMRFALRRAGEEAQQHAELRLHQEAEQKRHEQEQRRRVEEKQARRRAEEERRRREAEENARRVAEEEATRKHTAEREAARRVEEERLRREEDERQRRAAEETTRRFAEEEAGRRRAEEQEVARRFAEERRARVEEEARLRAAAAENFIREEAERHQQAQLRREAEEEARRRAAEYERESRDDATLPAITEQSAPDAPSTSAAQTLAAPTQRAPESGALVVAQLTDASSAKVLGDGSSAPHAAAILALLYGGMMRAVKDRPVMLISMVLMMGIVVTVLIWLGVMSEDTRANRNGAASGTPVIESQATSGNVDTSMTQTPPPGMVYVPGDTFWMGRDRDEGGDVYERPAHQVEVKPFFIDMYEVTNEEYATFVRRTNHRPPSTWEDGRYSAKDARKPVTGVTWNDANDYANWADKHLPTEAEWEYAARGTDSRLYPWGKSWRAGLANAGGGRGRLAEVGKYQGASPFGAFDMVGNAWEWTASTLSSYSNEQLPVEIKNDTKVIRGGSYTENRKQATTTYRGYLDAESDNNKKTGFRCIRYVTAASTP